MTAQEAINKLQETVDNYNMLVWLIEHTVPNVLDNQEE